MLYHCNQCRTRLPMRGCAHLRCPDGGLRLFCNFDCALLWCDLYYIHQFWDIRKLYTHDPVAQ